MGHTHDSRGRVLFPPFFPGHGTVSLMFGCNRFILTSRMGKSWLNAPWVEGRILAKFYGEQPCASMGRQFSEGHS